MLDTEGLIMIKIIVSLRQVNKLSTSVLGTPTFTSHQLPSKYTGELVGVEYLYQQSGGTFATKSEDLDKEIDEGFGDIEDQITDISPASTSQEMETVSFPSEESDVEVEEVNIIFCIIIICTHAWIHIPTTSPTPHTHIHT